MAKRIKRLGYIEFIDGHVEDIIKYEPSERLNGFIEFITTEGMYVYNEPISARYPNKFYEHNILPYQRHNDLFRIVIGINFHALDGIQFEGESYNVEFNRIVIFKRW